MFQLIGIVSFKHKKRIAFGLCLYVIPNVLVLV